VETDSGLSPAEHFKENGVHYAINGVEHQDIYGLTVITAKQSGTKTALRIHRILRDGEELPASIESIGITARLFRDHADLRSDEGRTPGMFRLTFSNLLLMADETSVNISGPVIGPLRYYCAGNMTAEVFTQGEENLL
jgi:hypothetical protein